MPQTCPRCGDRNVHHSRPRSTVERFRCRVTGRVPFRCHDCLWRGWRRDAPPAIVDGPRPLHTDLTERDLERLDLDPEVRPGDRT